jgi:hypothetical protein
METACGGCGAALPGRARFCPACGAATGLAERLEDVLASFQMHDGHDFRGYVRDGAGAVVGVRMLGAATGIVARLMEHLPGYVATERSRRPGVGDPDDWIRVDILRR